MAKDSACWCTGSGLEVSRRPKPEPTCGWGEIGPSDALRKWFAHDPRQWAAFQKKYARELDSKKELLRLVRQLEKQHGTVTLLYSEKDEEHNQAVALRRFLRKKQKP